MMDSLTLDNMTRTRTSTLASQQTTAYYVRGLSRSEGDIKCFTRVLYSLVPLVFHVVKWYA